LSFRFRGEGISSSRIFACFRLVSAATRTTPQPAQSKATSSIQRVWFSGGIRRAYRIWAPLERKRRDPPAADIRRLPSPALIAALSPHRPAHLLDERRRQAMSRGSAMCFLRGAPRTSRGNGLDQSARAISFAGRSCRASRARSGRALAGRQCRRMDCTCTARRRGRSGMRRRWLLPRHGRSGCSSQTQPMLSQTKHAMTVGYVLRHRSVTPASVHSAAAQLLARIDRTADHLHGRSYLLLRRQPLPGPHRHMQGGTNKRSARSIVQRRRPRGINIDFVIVAHWHIPKCLLGAGTGER
jgi:hypothetical protein